MNNNVNINDAWADFAAFQEAEAPKPNNTKPIKPIFNYNEDPIDMLNFTGFTNHHSIQESTEYYKVGKITKDIYFTMYPEKEGDVYPSNWIIPVIGHYKKIRELRAKRLKTKNKDAMKGMRLHIVVGVIIRCLLIQENIGIPVPVLLRFINMSLKRSQEKKEREPIKIETFETFRTDARKGLKDSIKQVIPQCYEDVQPEDLVNFTAYSLLRFKRDEVMKARRLARTAWNNGKGAFPDSTSPSVIAIGAIYTVMVMKNDHTNYDYRIFGITKASLLNAYKRVSSIVTNIELPHYSTLLNKPKPKKTKKKSSVK